MFLGMSPVRISFAGGGTDIPEYYETHGGNVLSTAITKFTYVIINPRHDNLVQAFSSDFQSHHELTSYDKLLSKHGMELFVTVIKYLNYGEGANFLISSDVPPGSGLGSSSALAVNLVKTISSLKGQEITKESLAEISYHIGRNILKWPIGKQDEYVSAFGGFNYIKFAKGNVNVVPIKMNKASFLELQQNLVLFYIGDTRTSSTILSTQIDLIKENQKDTMDSLNYVKNLAEIMYKSLKKSDITTFGDLLHKGWTAKKKFTKNVTNERIDRIYNMALKHGAIGGKLTGAGGGGHMLFYCESSKRQKLIEKMKNIGLKQIEFQFQNEGPKVMNLYDFVK
ncbi:MAG: D-glycero-D-manno-heptose 7-phosphate kinase [Thaumarchaeota archaeon]|nr:D-glycero-D-manno-heptose 7-phosphate kinase [Nitrososphaerota archaeon]